jgi:hypothetical protein
MADEAGQYRPTSIDRCPFAAAGEPCQIQEHSFRHRKTGPKIPLRVLYCKQHGAHFTLYPPGYVLYGRSCLAAVDLAGNTIEVLEPDPTLSCVSSKEVLFEAATDAAHDLRWESEPVENLDRPRYSTQRRRIMHCARLLGLGPGLPGPTVERIRDHLGIDGLDHESGRSRFHSSTSLASQGEVIVEVCRQSARDESLVPRLLASGHLSGLWGHPWLWDPARGQRFSVLARLGQVLRGPP